MKDQIKCKILYKKKINLQQNFNNKMKLKNLKIVHYKLNMKLKNPLQRNKNNNQNHYKYKINQINNHQIKH